MPNPEQDPAGTFCSLSLNFQVLDFCKRKHEKKIVILFCTNQYVHLRRLYVRNGTTDLKNGVLSVNSAKPKN